MGPAGGVSKPGFHSFTLGMLAQPGPAGGV